MVNRTKKMINVANTRQTVGGASIILASAFLASRLLGLLRDRLLVTHFGVGHTLDAYNAAFRLPEFLFTILISGAFAVAFIPVLTGYIKKDDLKMGWRVSSSLLNLMVIFTVLGGFIMAIFAGPLTYILAPGFDQSTHNLAVQLTQIMLLTPIFFAVSSVFGSIQQSFNRFTFYALAGVMYNLGIIFGILFLSKSFGIYGVAWGVVLGVILQACVQWLGLYGLGYKYAPVVGIRLKGVIQTIKLMIPRSIDQGIDQINYMVETMIGSFLAAGSITAFTLANNLKNVPLVLISSTITTAVFPRLAERAATGQREKLIEAYVQTARIILFLAIPAAAFTILTRGYIVRLLYGFGNTQTANTLGWFAGTIVFSSLYMLVARMFYAMQDTKTPLFVSLVSIPLNIMLSIILTKPYGVVGLAMAASIVAMLETITLGAILRHRQGNFGEAKIIGGGLKMALAGLIMGLVLYGVLHETLPLFVYDRGFTTLAPKFFMLLVVGAAAYLAPCYLLRIPEAKFFVARVKAMIMRPINLI